MKLNDLVEELNRKGDQLGDVDVVATDAEGNRLPIMSVEVDWRNDGAVVVLEVRW